jgi:dipeptidyl aminopeptidase/acylaminoacyl peptidase
MKQVFCVVFALLMLTFVSAQEKLQYQKPPESILELVDVPLAPSVRIDSEGEHMLLLSRNAYKSIADLSEEEMRLGGLRINPKINIGSRVRYYNNIELKKSESSNIQQIAGLPAEPRLAYIQWSPDQRFVAFTHSTENQVEVWLLDIEKATARRITEIAANANFGNPVVWMADSKHMLIRALPVNMEKLIDTDESVPSGPTISVSDGKKAQNRTYQDLLRNPEDEFNFELLTTSHIVKADLNGNTSMWLDNAKMYRGISVSPDGQYILVTNIIKPFSYLVPYRRFASQTMIYDRNGSLIKKILDVPLTEVLPKGFMSTREGMRSLQWRSDKPATLVWAEALDKGDPAVDAEYRDQVYQLHAPFDGSAIPLMKTINRFSGIMWAKDDVAFAMDYWWNTRNTKSYLFNPGDPNTTPKVISDRNYQDRYSDPGSLVRDRNEYNRNVVTIRDNKCYFMGDGFTPEGQFPFIDELDLKSMEKKRLYQSAFTEKYEDIITALDIAEGKFLVRLESKNEYPNYFIRNIKTNEPLVALTNFDNPFKSIQDVHKEVIKYPREDGLELEGTLYLPLGYDPESKKKAPMIIWAYPREFKDKNSASQKTSNPNRFIYPYYGSPIYWVTRGYVVLDNAAFPIVGEGEEEPNDSFRKQLVANAKASINAVDKLGYIDRNKVAIGGHSYGAFMVANLLSHSDLFAAGIARSGAYNRTLTPFGFQSEERSYWESPETYYKMSPFMHADKMKSPLLLIHGEADNNSGTYPLQSERYFNALKGLGATARLVMLPKESHGYSAKESILHLLWEQDQWLEKYVKNKLDKVDDEQMHDN